MCFGAAFYITVCNKSLHTGNIPLHASCTLPVLVEEHYSCVPIQWVHVHFPDRYTWKPIAIIYQTSTSKFLSLSGYLGLYIFHFPSYVPSGDDTYSPSISTNGSFPFGRRSVDKVYVSGIFTSLETVESVETRKHPFTNKTCMKLYKHLFWKCPFYPCTRAPLLICCVWNV